MVRLAFIMTVCTKPFKVALIALQTWWACMQSNYNWKSTVGFSFYFWSGFKILTNQIQPQFRSIVVLCLYLRVRSVVIKEERLTKAIWHSPLRSESSLPHLKEQCSQSIVCMDQFRWEWAKPNTEHLPALVANRTVPDWSSSRGRNCGLIIYFYHVLATLFVTFICCSQLCCS